MCDTCGCGDPTIVPVEVHETLLAGNDRAARHNRDHFREHGVVAINLMGSPGSGKTAILEATARALGVASPSEGGATRIFQHAAKLGALSGDLATTNDADRLARAGIRSAAITTGSACHLDAALVHHALHDLAWHDLDLLFIENVGNLVCPAIYDLGQAANVVALSVTEGEDKPLKYPVMFRKADLVLLNKIDLLPHLDVDIEAIVNALGRVMPDPQVILVSGRTGEGIEQWRRWLEGLRFREGSIRVDRPTAQA